jgi:hypothetical protein
MSPYEQRKFNLMRKIQAWMFKDSIEIFLKGLIEFNEGLIARKLTF